ncbi:MAG TPA: type II secretion system F family protein [Albitalea sp.]|nr:type II secretion system F family protein [Albitalea sp.]
MAISLLAWSIIDIGTHALPLYRRVFTERTHFSLRELFLFVEPERLFALNVATIGIAGAAAWLLSGSLFLAIGVASAAGMLPRTALRLLQQRRRNAIEYQLPDALLLLAGGMKAGVSLTQAIQQLVAEAQPPISQEFDLVLREQRLGMALDEALDNLNRRVPLQSVTLTVSAMRIAADTGGQLAETLERASQTLRTKLAMEAKIRALTSQGKLQAVVVGALPLLLIFVLGRMEPHAMRLLFTTQVGWATLAVIALLEISGVVLIRKIVDIDV